MRAEVLAPPAVAVLAIPSQRDRVRGMHDVSTESPHDLRSPTRLR